MPAPLVAAGAAAIARFIAQKGMKEAVKKFGKKAVDEAKKHGKDMVTKPTSGQSKVKKAVSGQRANRETMRRTAGVAGLAGYGAGKMNGGSEATKPKAKAKAKAKPKAKDPRTNPKDFPVYGKSTDSAKAFREAQRKAKRNGQKTFTFEGRRYNTTEK